MSKENYIYLVDNEIQFYSYKKDKLFIQKLPKGIIHHGRIIDHKKFYKQFNKFANCQNLTNFFLLEKLCVIINSSSYIIDKYIFKEVFEKLGYKKIRFINELEKIPNANHKTFINFNEYYTIIYTKKHNKTVYKLIDNKLFTNLELRSYINKNCTKNKYIFGNNKNIYSFFDSSNEYIFQYPSTYIIDKFSSKI